MHILGIPRTNCHYFSSNHLIHYKTLQLMHFEPWHHAFHHLIKLKQSPNREECPAFFLIKYYHLRYCFALILVSEWYLDLMLISQHLITDEMLFDSDQGVAIHLDVQHCHLVWIPLRYRWSIRFLDSDVFKAINLPYLTFSILLI